MHPIILAVSLAFLFFAPYLAALRADENAEQDS